MKKILVFFLLSVLFICNVKAQDNDMYKEVWNNDVYKGIDELINTEKYTKLYEFQDNYLLEFRYYKDDTYSVIVLFDKDGNVINYNYLLLYSNEDSNMFYHYKDRIYGIEEYNDVITIYNNKLEKIDSLTAYDKDGLNVPIYDVTFHDDSMYVVYRITSGNGLLNKFYICQYNLDAKYVKTYFYEYESQNRLISSSEQISDEVHEKQLYFYDVDMNKSLTFNYDMKEFMFVDYVVESDDNYYSILNVFCEANYLCDYGKIGDYYYVDNHKYNDDTNYTYGNVSIKDDDLVELFKFKNYSYLLDKLMVANDKYFIYTVNQKESDSTSKIYNSSINKLEDMDIENAILTKIFNNDLYVVSLVNRNIKITKYDLAYDIFIGNSENGAISVDDNNKFVGEEVFISVSSINGYLDSLSVVTEDGDEVEVINNKFIMPESDVYINAKFIEGVKNPDTSDFLIRSIFILLICLCILFYIRKYKWS